VLCGYREKSTQNRWRLRHSGRPRTRAAIRVNTGPEGLAAETFLNEIENKDAVPFAIKPVTLELLLNTYQRRGQLPSGQTALYAQGCKLLCEETNISRRDSRRTGLFSAEQRLATAARIAAMTVFCNRDAIWLVPDRGDVPDVDLTVAQIAGGTESVSGNEFSISEAAVEDTLATGLFSSRGPNRIGWAHQTYAEYLAARYLLERGTTLSQMVSVIVDPNDRGNMIVPQLHEAAAWVASMVPGVFREILRNDPTVLLKSDVASADVRDRAALVENLLRLHEEGRIIHDWQIHRMYRKLRHPALTHQLRPYIQDKNKAPVARRVAIEIAQNCELREIADELVAVALDSTEKYGTRVRAAWAVTETGDDSTRAELRPLVVDVNPTEDPDDELKGCGLRAVWPHALSVDELLAALSAPQNPSVFGAYQGFLRNELTPRLQPGDIPLVLGWIERQRPTETWAFQGFGDQLVLKAWQNLDFPGTLEALAKFVFSRLKNHSRVLSELSDVDFKQLTNDDEARRHRLAGAMLAFVSDPEQDSLWLAYPTEPVLTTADLPWVLERFRYAESDRARLTLAKLARRLFWRDQTHLHLIIEASRDEAVLAHEFASVLGPVVLDSPEAIEMRSSYLEMQSLESSEKAHSPSVPSPTERIKKLLDEFELGDLNAFWQLNLEMTRDEKSRYYGDQLQSDLTALPGWKCAEEETRARIVRAAKRFLDRQDPGTRNWIGTDNFYRPPMAGYRALRLLLHEALRSFSELSAEVWTLWAPVTVAFPVADSNADDHHQIVQKAYRNAPDVFIQALEILIDRETAKHGKIFITRRLLDCWDQRLGQVLLEKAKDERVKPECRGSLLGDLLEHRIAGAREYATSLIQSMLAGVDGTRPNALVAALCTYGARRRRRLVYRVASHSARSSVWSRTGSLGFIRH
jgi:predicted NACHT family NTPase